MNIDRKEITEAFCHDRDLGSFRFCLFHSPFYIPDNCARFFFDVCRCLPVGQHFIQRCIISELVLVLHLASDNKEDTENKPKTGNQPFLRYQGCSGSGEDIEDQHDTGHQNGKSTCDFAIFYLVRSWHRGFLFSQDQEGK